MKFNDILDANQRQITIDEYLALDRDESPQLGVAAVTIGPDHGQLEISISPEIGPEPHNGFPSGWMYQIDMKRDFAKVLAEVVDIYQRKFGRKPKTIWANPATGDGNHVNHDKRIGRGYLLLGPLPIREV